ncbi:MAG: phosphotransferase family protein [Halobacteriales archaeon]
MTDEDVSEAYLGRLVDEAALSGYLREHLGPAEDFEVTRHAQGHSNETLYVTWGDRDLVVRRPPPGETAETAHDVLREYRVTDALQDTDVPVPPTVLGCEDESVIGSDFYLMDRLDGVVARGEEPDLFAGPDRRETVGRELVDTLAAIHGVDYEAVGLGEFGRPDGFTERQVRRWTQQLMWAFDTTADEREVPALYEVMEWLEDNVPEDHPHALVHGDYKLDNVMFAPADADGATGPTEGDDATGPTDAPPAVVGVFDWEMATLGDPRTDLGWLLIFWREADDPPPIAPEFVSRFMERRGYPTREQLVDRWEAATGLSFEHEQFYRTLATYKLAGLGEMFYARHLQGNADDPLYPKMADQVPALAERALSIIDGDRPL